MSAILSARLPATVPYALRAGAATVALSMQNTFLFGYHEK